MSPKDPRDLLPGYTMGSLSKVESEFLLNKALENQDLFSALMNAEPVRQAAADPAFRSKLRAELRERRLAEGMPLGERLRRLFSDPLFLPAVSLALTALLVVGYKYGFVDRNSPAVQMAPPGARMLTAGILDVREGEPQRLQQVKAHEPSTRAEGAIVLSRSGDNPTYRLGEDMRFRFRLPAAANVMVVDERSDGSVVRFFPNKLQSSARVEANQEIAIPPPGQGNLRVEGALGSRSLKLFVFPADVDPMDFSQPLESQLPKATVLTRTYEVVR